MGNVFDTRIFERWWLRAFVALVLFFVWQLVYAISRVQSLDEERSTLQAEIDGQKRKSDALRLDIVNKEREVLRMEKRLEELESQVRDRVSLLPRGRADAPMIWFVSPTAWRPAQRADLTRLSYTLAHVPNLHWLVVEDAASPSKAVGGVLRASRVRHTHVAVQTPADMKMKFADPNWRLPRGVEQRNTALAWLRTQLSSAKMGVVYFGDDDNTYDLRLFNEIRKVKKAGIWPVGIVGGQIVEAPIAAENGTITGFNANWKPERTFPVDMAAFAVNLTLVLQRPDAGFSYDVPRGHQETRFLEQLGVTRENLEPLADGCTKVLVWHTRTEKPTMSGDMEKRLKAAYNVDLRDSVAFSNLEADALGLDI